MEESIRTPTSREIRFPNGTGGDFRQIHARALIASSRTSTALQTAYEPTILSMASEMRDSLRLVVRSRRRGQVCRRAWLAQANSRPYRAPWPMGLVAAGLELLGALRAASGASFPLR